MLKLTVVAILMFAEGCPIHISTPKTSHRNLFFMPSFNSIEHVIWDWNGTLVDDVQLCVDVINRILHERDLPTISVRQYRETFDFPVIDYYHKLGFDMSKDSFEALTDEFISAYEKGRWALQLQSGAKEALQVFHRNRIPQCMLSAANKKTLLSNLGQHGLTAYFKSILALNHHYAHGKIELGHQWIRNNHLKKEKILYIGDTLHDLQVAKAMGVNCILVVNGHNSKDRLRAHHHEVAPNLPEVLRRLNF